MDSKLTLELLETLQMMALRMHQLIKEQQLDFKPVESKTIIIDHYFALMLGYIQGQTFILQLELLLTTLQRNQSLVLLSIVVNFSLEV